MLTHERLLEVLDYDPETGLLTWRIRMAQRVKVGGVAGSLNPDGYIQIRVLGTIYKAHRLIWFYVHKEWPDLHIDHANGKRNDNRIQNLRLATEGDNMANSRKRVTSRAKYKGIYLHRFSGLWHARVTKNYKTVSLGYFKTQEQAHAAYAAAASKVFGEFYNSGEAGQT